MKLEFDGFTLPFFSVTFLCQFFQRFFAMKKHVKVWYTMVYPIYAEVQFQDCETASEKQANEWREPPKKSNNFAFGSKITWFTSTTAMRLIRGLTGTCWREQRQTGREWRKIRWPWKKGYWLVVWYRGFDYTTQINGDYKKPLSGSRVPIKEAVFQWKVRPGF